MTHWTPDTDPDCTIIISDDPATRGQLLGFVRPSKVHANPEDVASENRAKNRICTEVQKTYAESNYSWHIEPEDRTIVITLNTKPTRAEKDELAATLSAVSEKVRVDG